MEGHYFNFFIPLVHVVTLLILPLLVITLVKPLIKPHIWVILPILPLIEFIVLPLPLRPKLLGLIGLTQVLVDVSWEEVFWGYHTIWIA